MMEDPIFLKRSVPNYAGVGNLCPILYRPPWPKLFNFLLRAVRRAGGMMLVAGSLVNGPSMEQVSIPVGLLPPSPACPRAIHPQAMHPQPHTPLGGQKNTCEKITFSQLRWRAVNIYLLLKFLTYHRVQLFQWIIFPWYSLPNVVDRT